MAIRISQRKDVFHVPYAIPNNEGTPDSSFVDLKTHPEWIAVLPPCVGWPETIALLRAVNSPVSSLMSLATGQAFVPVDHPEQEMALTSFITLCYAALARNDRETLASLAEFLKARTSEMLQRASDTLERRLFLEMVIEVQPTMFHLQRVSAWSLTVLTATYGPDEGAARSTWGIGMKALQEALIESDHRKR